MRLTDGRASWRFRLRLGAVVALWFAVIYVGADWIMRQGTHLPSLATPLDALIPFRPGFAAAYLSVTPFLWLPLFLVPARGDLLALGLTLMVEIAGAGVIYLIFPIASPPVPDVTLPALYRLSDVINLTRNNLPSLHVALTVTTTLTLVVHAPRLRLLWGTWGGLIVVSTLLTRQHDLASVGAGLLLALAGYFLLLPRLRRWSGPG